MTETVPPASNPRQRIAVSIPVPLDVQAALKRAEWAEGEGFDDLWFADGGVIDSLTLAAAVALRTSRVRVGTAVIPVFTRTPAVFASTTATLSQLMPGRFVLGLGASSHAMVEGWHGLEYRKPLTRVKETTLILRGMLRGEKSAFDGEELRSHGYNLNPGPATHVPIHLAALRANMLELAGELGEGVVINLFPYDALEKMLHHVDAGARKAGASLAQREVVCRHQICVTDDPAAARDQFRKNFAPYYATPVYNKFLAWAGYEEAAQTINEGWAERNRAKTGGALSDELVDKIAIIGTADQCRERVRQLAQTGVTTHIISPMCPDPAIIEATFDAFRPTNFQLP